MAEPREVEQLRLAAMGEHDVPMRNELQVVCRYITEQAETIDRVHTVLRMSRNEHARTSKIAEDRSKFEIERLQKEIEQLKEENFHKEHGCRPQPNLTTNSP